MAFKSTLPNNYLRACQYHTFLGLGSRDWDAVRGEEPMDLFLNKPREIWRQSQATLWEKQVSPKHFPFPTSSTPAQAYLCGFLSFLPHLCSASAGCTSSGQGLWHLLPHHEKCLSFHPPIPTSSLPQTTSLLLNCHFHGEVFPNSLDESFSQHCHLPFLICMIL